MADATNTTSDNEPDILDELQRELQAELEDERPPHAGPWAQLSAALVTLALGILGLVLSLRYGLGTLLEPGPGMWPLALSVVVVVMSLALMLTGRHGTDTEKFSGASVLTLVGVVSLVVMGALIPVIGFEIPSLLMAFVWLRFLGKESWRSSIVISVVTIAAFYAIFVIALSIPLPRLIAL